TVTVLPVPCAKVQVAGSRAPDSKSSHREKLVFLHRGGPRNASGRPLPSGRGPSICRVESGLAASLIASSASGRAVWEPARSGEARGATSPASAFILALPPAPPHDKIVTTASGQTFDRTLGGWPPGRRSYDTRFTLDELACHMGERRRATQNVRIEVRCESA